MRARALTALFLVFMGLAAAASPAAAVSPPTCFGKPATQWLTQPGTLLGTAGNDVFVGSAGADILDAFTFHVGSTPGGVDLICGRGGDDSIALSGPGSKADGGSGNDAFYVGTGAWATGGSGNETMVADGAGSIALGGSGNDQLAALDGGTIDGSSGNDELQAGGDDVVLRGGSGEDLLQDHPSGGTHQPLRVTLDCGTNFDSYSVTGPSTTVAKSCERNVSP